MAILSFSLNLFTTNLELLKNINLSLMSAAIFYFFVQKVPYLREERSALDISASILLPSINQYFNAVYAVCRDEISTDNINTLQEKLIANDDRWDNDYMTCNWATHKSTLAYSGYNKKYINIYSGKYVSNKEFYHEQIKYLIKKLKELMFKYGRFFDHDYKKEIENFLESDGVYYQDCLFEKCSDDRAEYIVQNLRSMLFIYKKNKRYKSKLDSIIKKHLFN